MVAVAYALRPAHAAGRAILNEHAVGVSVLEPASRSAIGFQLNLALVGLAALAVAFGLLP